jgi:hypothetical protein
MYFTSNDLENVKSRFSFLLSSITWIIIESLKLALSMLDSKFDVYWVAAADPAGKFIYAFCLLFVAAEIVPPLFVILIKYK